MATLKAFRSENPTTPIWALSSATEYIVTTTNASGKTITVTEDASGLVAGDKLWFIDDASTNSAAFTVASTSGTGPTVITVDESPGADSMTGALWKTQTPASGDTLDTQSFTLYGGAETGYPGSAGTTYTIIDTVGGGAYWTSYVNTDLTSQINAGSGGTVGIGTGLAKNYGILVALSGGTVTFDQYGWNYGLVIAESGGTVNISNAGAGNGNWGTLIAKSGGAVTLGSATSSYGRAVAESGGTVTFDGSYNQCSAVAESGGTVTIYNNQGSAVAESGGEVDISTNSGAAIAESGGVVTVSSNTGFVGYYTGGTVTGADAVAFGSERRSTHYTGNLTSTISILNANTTLANTGIIVAKQYVLNTQEPYTGAGNGTLTLSPANKTLENATYGIGGNGSTGTIPLGNVTIASGGTLNVAALEAAAKAAQLAADFAKLTIPAQDEIKANVTLRAFDAAGNQTTVLGNLTAGGTILDPTDLQTILDQLGARAPQGGDVGQLINALIIKAGGTPLYHADTGALIRQLITTLGG